MGLSSGLGGGSGMSVIGRHDKVVAPVPAHLIK
jgi:hypothetical protein